MQNQSHRAVFQTSTPIEIKNRMLAELQESMGDIAEELLPDLAPMLLEDAPNMLSSLRQAIADDDALKVKEFAHTFKGSCASMGIVTLAAHCQDLENMGRENRLDKAPAKLAHAEAEYEQVRQALSQYA